MPVILALRRRRQGDCELKASLCYVVKICLKTHIHPANHNPKQARKAGKALLPTNTPHAVTYVCAGYQHACRSHCPAVEGHHDEATLTEDST